MKADIDNYIVSTIEKGDVFTFDGLDQHIKDADHRMQSFPKFIEERISARSDIRESSKKHQWKIIGSLMEFGRIINFSDLTRSNIIAYDDFLQTKGIRQSTIHSYHKILKTYINEAIRRGIMPSSPYADVKIKRGESECSRWLTEAEFRKIKDMLLPTEALRIVRDMFVVQCLTGLSYADLQKADFSHPQEDNGRYYLTGVRVKTGKVFCTVLLPEVMEILSMYSDKLPKISNHLYNTRLKILAKHAGIDKPIASHWGRRTCGMLLLNRGVSIEIVAKVLGHSSIRITESAYARILNKSVIDVVSDKMRL
ncbi:MAG: site-specific integrase [Alistipes indistinctus]